MLEISVGLDQDQSKLVKIYISGRRGQILDPGATLALKKMSQYEIWLRPHLAIVLCTNFKNYKV